MAVEQIGSAASATVPPPVSAHARPAASVPESQVTLASRAKAISPPDAIPGIDAVRDAIKEIELVVPPAAQDLRFSIDDDTGITVVKLIDTQTQTVLRQIPTQEVMEISKALDKLKGLLVRNKA
jgi:flagellar protein FlaG